MRHLNKRQSMAVNDIKEWCRGQHSLEEQLRDQ